MKMLWENYFLCFLNLPPPNSRFGIYFVFIDLLLENLIS